MSEEATTETTTTESTETSTTSSEVETSQESSQDTQTEEQSSSIADAISGKENTDSVKEEETTASDASDSSDAQADENGEDPIEDYDLEVAEDSPLSQEELDAIAQYAEENKLTKSQAENIIKNREGLINQGLTIAEQRQKEIHQKMSSDFLAHSDFNEQNRAESFASIKRAVDQFGDESLVEALNDPVIGNNIAVGQFLKKIGDLIGPEGFEGMKPGKGDFGKEGNTREERMRRLYPEHFNEK